MSKWTLIEDGDHFEQVAWPLIQEDFPDYEVFWSKFVVPTTCRESVPKEHRLWLHFKRDVDPDVQRIAMAHYTIFRSLIFIRELVFVHNQPDPRRYAPFTASKRVDNFFIYLGIVFDNAENLVWYIHKLRHRFGLEKKPPYNRLTNAEVQQIFGEYLKDPETYDTDLNDFISTRRPVSIKLYTPSDSLVILRDPKNRSDYNKYSNLIKKYRNVVVHNPQIGAVVDKDWTTWIPKKEKIRSYLLWGDVFYKRDASDFVRAQETMEHDIVETCNLLNRCWAELISLYDEVAKQPGYTELLGRQPPALDLFYTPTEGMIHSSSAAMPE